MAYGFLSIEPTIQTHPPSITLLSVRRGGSTNGSAVGKLECCFHLPVILSASLFSLMLPSNFVRSLTFVFPVSKIDVFTTWNSSTCSKILFLRACVNNDHSKRTGKQEKLTRLTPFRKTLTARMLTWTSLLQDQHRKETFLRTLLYG